MEISCRSNLRAVLRKKLRSYGGPLSSDGFLLKLPAKTDKNKAGYTATQTASEWARAVIKRLIKHLGRSSDAKKRP